MKSEELLLAAEDSGHAKERKVCAMYQSCVRGAGDALWGKYKLCRGTLGSHRSLEKGLNSLSKSVLSGHQIVVHVDVDHAGSH